MNNFDSVCFVSILMQHAVNNFVEYQFCWCFWRAYRVCCNDRYVSRNEMIKYFLIDTLFYVQIACQKKIFHISGRITNENKKEFSKGRTGQKLLYLIEERSRLISFTWYVALIEYNCVYFGTIQIACTNFKPPRKFPHEFSSFPWHSFLLRK